MLKLLELYEEETGLPAPDTGLSRVPTSMAARDLALSAATASAFARLGLAHMAGVLLAAPRASVITQRTQVATARHLAETLGDLKGVAMKVGQLFAYADVALDAPLKTELRALLATSRPMSPALVTRVFLQELGVRPRQLFASGRRCRSRRPRSDRSIEPACEAASSSRSRCNTRPSPRPSRRIYAAHCAGGSPDVAAPPRPGAGCVPGGARRALLRGV